MNVKTDLTICISTFRGRFRELKNLVEQIRVLSALPIQIAVNGEPEGFDENYRQDLYRWASYQRNVNLIMFSEFRSLAKLWNTMIVHAATEWCYILNDDLNFENMHVFSAIENHINSTPSEPGCFLCPANSWSHFVISKKCAHEVGYFDERLLGVSHEDGDFAWRFEDLYNTKPNQITNLPGIHNLGNYDTHSEKINTFTGNKSEFNRWFCEEQKYAPSNKGHNAMFSMPMVKVLNDETQYPYEQFFKENKLKILKTSL